MSIEINSRMNCGTLQEYSVVVAEKLNILLVYPFTAL
jgi:hypothetical protein